MYQNQNTIVLRDGQYMAVAQVTPYAKSYELCIWVCNIHHMCAANRCLTKGGRLPTEARAHSAGLLLRLLREALVKWRGLRLTWNAPDERRARIYAAMLRRARIPFTLSGLYFTVNWGGPRACRGRIRGRAQWRAARAPDLWPG